MLCSTESADQVGSPLGTTTQVTLSGTIPSGGTATFSTANGSITESGKIGGEGTPSAVRFTQAKIVLPGESSHAAGVVEIHRGGPKGVAEVPSWTLLPPDDTTVAFGATLVRP
jgi:hypothetical protein